MSANAPQFPDTPQENPYGSPEAILEVLSHVQKAFIELICSTGADPKVARESARRLDLSINQYWPVSRFINAEDILTASGEVAERINFERVCKACEAKGAVADLVHQARQNIAKYEEMVSLCAGDRRSFSLLMKGLSRSDVTNSQESVRRLAFWSNSSLWGVQCHLSFKTTIVVPNTENPDYVDAIRIFGMVDFRRLRRVQWPLCWMFAYSDDGALIHGNSHPIKPPSAGLAIDHVLKDFCSDPLPDLRSIRREYGLRIDICEGPIGNAGLLTCVVADRLNKVQPLNRTPQKNESLAVTIDLVTPQQHMNLDIFQHKDLPFSDPPQCDLFDRLTIPRGFDPESNSDRKLPLSSQVLDLGHGLAGCTLSQYPRYRELMEYVFLQLGMDSDEFRGFRISITYPQIPTAAVLHWDLPRESKR